MIRIVKLSGKLYGKKILSVKADSNHIETFIEEGSPVIIVEELEDLDVLGMDSKSVIMVESN